MLDGILEGKFSINEQLNSILKAKLNCRSERMLVGILEGKFLINEQDGRGLQAKNSRRIKFPGYSKTSFGLNWYSYSGNLQNELLRRISL